MNSSSALYKRGFKDGLPIAFGYLPLALAIGIAAISAGLKFGNSIFMSLTMYSGTAQAAILNLISGGETIVFTYLLTFFIVNCRYILLSVSMSQKLDPKMSVLSRMAFAPFNTDEIFAVAMQQQGNLGASYLFGLATAPYIAWSLGIILGLVFSSALPPAAGSAFGITMPAMLLALVIPPSRKSKSIAIVVALAAGINILLNINPFVKNFIGAGWSMIICSVVTALAGAIMFPVNNDDSNKEVN
ncbi:MAG: AzlC family ABC transporter permease [Oscillospiraceae bacterium]|jgi:predicted branched-subunit amino acid permease|nr:AzlC family ABC transporter permease [Oscillospiraceae bacterium]